MLLITPGVIKINCLPIESLAAFVYGMGQFGQIPPLGAETNDKIQCNLAICAVHEDVTAVL